MKNFLRILTPAVGLSVALPATFGADNTKPAPKPETRELRALDSGNPEALRGKPRTTVIGRPAAGEMEMVTFLGVETGAVSAALAAQLGLAPDTGLVVNQVVADSPAAGALKEHDVLLKLDDQVLIERRQLAVLVRNRKEGDEIALTYLRAGKQATARVKLARRNVPKVTMMFERELPMAAGVAWSPDMFEVVAPPPREDGRGETDRVLRLMRPESVTPGTPMGGARPLAQGRVERREGIGLRATSLNLRNSNLVFSDEMGSLELTLRDGKKTLVAKGADGAMVFSGPVTTPEERKALPEGVRDRLEKLEGMHDVTFRTDGDFQGTEMRVVQPMARGISLPVEVRPAARSSGAF